MVVDAVREGFLQEAGGGDARMSGRMLEGRVIFEDGQGRQFKEVPAATVFRKITSVREKLRVLEQKVNASKLVDLNLKAEQPFYVLMVVLSW